MDERIPVTKRWLEWDQLLSELPLTGEARELWYKIDTELMALPYHEAEDREVTIDLTQAEIALFTPQE